MFRESPLHKNAPLSAAVESDVVGYTTIEMQAGKWYQVGTPFVALDGTQAPRINDVFNMGFQDGDVLYIYQDTGYTTYLTWKNSGTETAGWCTSRGTTPTDTVIPSGHAVFILKNSTSLVQVAGSVSEKVPTEFGSETAGSWSQIVCVYPQETKLNALEWTGIEDGDRLFIFSPESNGYSQTYTWKNSGTPTAGWCSSRGSTPVDVTLPIGQGLFVNKVNAGIATCRFAK